MRDAGETAGLRVRAPARLHLGFIDLGASLGRQFGSLGLTIARPALQVTVRAAGADTVTGPDQDRAAAARDTVRGALGLTGGCAIEIQQGLAPHGGLGSGTQIALAVGTAIARLAGQDPSPRELARLLGRGRRSAIGTEAFAAGGIILDGGRAQDAPPPLLARYACPDRWRVLLAFDAARQGLSGPDEAQAMDRLPPFPAALAAHISHLLLMKALPALAEGEMAPFGAAIGEWQALLGDHYARAQGGGRFLSPDVAQVAAFLKSEGLEGIGQSSWGPTGFALVGDPVQAETLLETLRRRFASFTNLSFDCVRGDNAGAVFSPVGAAVP